MRYRTSQAHRAWWFPAVALAIVAVLTWAPVVAAGVSAASPETAPSSAAKPQGTPAPFTPAASSESAPRKFASDTEASTASETLVSALPKRQAPVPQAAPRPATSTQARTTASSTGRTTTRSTTSRTTTRATATTTTRTSTASELSQARAILASLISAHPICAGATVSIGTTPGGYQAVCYYKSGRILISPTHTASLRTILNHEIWHIIDWRDNGRIDWGENVPR